MSIIQGPARLAMRRGRLDRLGLWLPPLHALALLGALGVSGAHSRADVTIEKLTRWGGSTSAVAVRGSSAYMGSGWRTLILDISDPDRPVEISALDFGSYALDIVPIEGYLFVMHSIWGRVVDIRDPRAPQVLPEILGFGGRAGAVRGNALYQASSFDVETWDVTDPRAPILANRFTLEHGIPHDLALQGDFLYVAANVGSSPGWLYVFDVSNAPSPALRGAVETPREASDVAVSGEWAYVTTELGLTAVNIADPDNPRVVDTFPLQRSNDVQVVGGHALVAGERDNEHGLIVLDLGDPGHPAFTTHLRTHSFVWRIFLQDDTAYLATTEGMVVVDVSDPARLLRRGQQYSPSAISATALDGDVLYVVSPGAGLGVLDVSDPCHPRLISEYTTGPNAADIELRDGLAYVAAGARGLEIYDISDPSQLRLVGSVNAGPEAVSVGLMGELAVVGNYANSAARVVDISRPEQPVVIATIPEINVDDIETAGDFAFLAAGATRIVDLSDPRQPVVCDLFRGTDNDVKGDRLFTATGRFSVPGLVIYDISEPCAAQEIGSYQPAGNKTHGMLAVEVRGRRAYMIGTSSSGLHIVDISDPADVRFLTQYNGGGGGSHLTIDEPYIFQSRDFRGLTVYQVSLDGDLDDDDDVDLSDLGILLSDFGCTAGPGACPGDVDDDGDTDLRDLEILLDNFGKAAR